KALVERSDKTRKRSSAMQEYFRPTPPEFLALARFWAETRCHLWLNRLRLDRVRPTDDQIIGHATERLGEIAAEVEEEDVAEIVAEVGDRRRQLSGDDRWRVLKEGLPEERQALAEEWATPAAPPANPP